MMTTVWDTGYRSDTGDGRLHGGTQLTQMTAPSPIAIPEPPRLPSKNTLPHTQPHAQARMHTRGVGVRVCVVLCVARRMDKRGGGAEGGGTSRATDNRHGYTALNHARSTAAARPHRAARRGQARHRRLGLQSPDMHKQKGSKKKQIK
jgi:hypothetical protein